MRRETNNNHRLLKYIRLHPEGLTMIQLAQYSVQIGVVDEDFTNTVSDLISQGDVFELRPGVIVPLDPIQDSEIDLQLTPLQREQIAYLIGRWYYKWKGAITDDHLPHRLGFAAENLKLILTGTRDDQDDARKNLARIRAECPEMAALIEGLDARR